MTDTTTAAITPEMISAGETMMEWYGESYCTSQLVETIYAAMRALEPVAPTDHHGVGDVVYLNSGSPPLVVIKVDGETITTALGDGTEHTFQSVCLTHTPRQPRIASRDATVYATN